MNAAGAVVQEGGELVGEGAANELLANCLIFPTAVDITKVVNDLIEEGWEIDPVDLATITPYITSRIRRFGTWHLEPPDGQAVGHLRPAARTALCDSAS
ncbi:Tn3 family transposase [Streptomyces viridosporus]|uniref:Tn3 family transposase n=1 Tax=Streptomyces viridosporus TaxID=67581 RepID=UPI0036FEA2CB